MEESASGTQKVKGEGAYTSYHIIISYHLHLLRRHSDIAPLRSESVCDSDIVARASVLWRVINYFIY